MQKCLICNEIGETGDFYSSCKSRCKNCVRAAVRANRSKNAEYYRQFDRDRANDPKRVHARKEYAQTERGKSVRTEGSKAWVQRNPERRHAQIVVGNSLRDGKLVRGVCQCGEIKVQAHHDDYSKPLEVRWMCMPCHAAHHKSERAFPFNRVRDANDARKLTPTKDA